MSYFSWSDDMSVGNRYIDADHRKIIDIINQLHDAMRDGGGSEVVVKKVIFELIVYTKGHFQREEVQMKAIGFAGFEAHKREHELLLDQLTKLSQEFKENPLNKSIKISKFLYTWLMRHIIRSDMELSRQLKKTPGQSMSRAAPT